MLAGEVEAGELEIAVFATESPDDLSGGETKIVVGAGDFVDCVGVAAADEVIAFLILWETDQPL